jgi:cell division protein FtsQ
MSTPAATPFDIRMMQRVTTWLWMLVAVLVAAVVLSLLSRSPYFTLKAIVVEGQTTHHNPLTLRANVAPRLSGNFFSIDLQETKGVFESLPWVRQAVVKREFPNKLRVVLQEHQLAGLWGRDSEYQMLNTQGEVFEANPADADMSDPPHFFGPREQSPLVLQFYRGLNAQLKPHDMAIEELELTGHGSWRATLDTGTVMELGRGDLTQITQRTQAFLDTATQATSQWGRKVNRDIETVDLRHSNGYAIKLKGVGTLAAKAGGTQTK